MGEVDAMRQAESIKQAGRQECASARMRRREQGTESAVEHRQTEHRLERAMEDHCVTDGPLAGIECRVYHEDEG